MKKKKFISIIICIIVLTACSQETAAKIDDKQSAISASSIQKKKETKQVTSDIENISYIGAYDEIINGETEGYNDLAVGKTENDEYHIFISIVRLATFKDGIGELTDEGMTFTATDPVGSPIHGIITLDGDIATVLITDTTWDLLENGDHFEYLKTSDNPFDCDRYNKWGQ